jgi:tight adherence protein B
MGNFVLLAILMVSLAVFLLFIGLVMVFRARSFDIAGRVAQLPAPSVRVGVGTRISPARAKPGRLSRLLGTGTAPDLATELARADLRLTPTEYVLVNFGTMLIGFVLGFILFHQYLVLSIVGGFVGMMAPRFYLRYLQRKRVSAFEKQLGDTLTLLGNSMRTGYGLLQSIETVSRELAAPVSTEFARVVREVGLGLTLPEALENLLRRVPSDDLDFVITAINIQYEVGGNLAQVLDSISHTIRERVRIIGEIRVLTAQQRLSALILTILPIISGLLIFMVNPSYMSELWKSTCGLAVMVAGAILMVIGYFVVQRIANIPV